MGPGLIRSPNLGIYSCDDDPADLRRVQKTRDSISESVIRASQRKVDSKRRAAEKKADQERQQMASATRTQHCSICGHQYGADFDQSAYDNLNERCKWRLWNKSRRCPTCEVTKCNPDPRYRYCTSCGIAIEREADQSTGSWAATFKCRVHKPIPG
jgi:rubredoxin